VIRWWPRAASCACADCTLYIQEREWMSEKLKITNSNSKISELAIKVQKAGNKIEEDRVGLQQAQ
jgi:hypothetical protein